MIESAQYVADPLDATKISGISVVWNGETTFVSGLDGGTWLQVELQRWVADGNAIAPAATS